METSKNLNLPEWDFTSSKSFLDIYLTDEDKKWIESKNQNKKIWINGKIEREISGLSYEALSSWLLSLKIKAFWEHKN